MRGFRIQDIRFVMQDINIGNYKDILYRREK